MIMGFFFSFPLFVLARESMSAEFSDADVINKFSNDFVNVSHEIIIIIIIIIVIIIFFSFYTYLFIVVHRWDPVMKFTFNRSHYFARITNIT